MQGERISKIYRCNSFYDERFSPCLSPIKLFEAIYLIKTLPERMEDSAIVCLSSCC